MTPTMKQTPVLDFSDDQLAALEEIQEWHQSNASPYFTLGGYAGTGKSTLVSYLYRQWPMTAVCALAGKAAQVLRSKGVPASTIHRLIYYPVKGLGGEIHFELKDELPGVEQVVVDEASMVPQDVFDHLMSFGLPVLFVGDHGQLEPIGASPRLMDDPYVRLERIHRQAEGNPILRFAEYLRQGKRAQDYEYEECPQLKIVPKSECDDYIDNETQIICGYNNTRHFINKEQRTRRGHKGLVCVGETLICLKNNYEYGIFNGQQLLVKKVGSTLGDIINLLVETDDADGGRDSVTAMGREVWLPCLRRQFGADPVDSYTEKIDKGTVLTDYGYCLTMHKAQGSEWNKVLIYEQIARSWDPARWSYTGVTRGRQEVVYCV